MKKRRSKPNWTQLMRATAFSLCCAALVNGMPPLLPVPEPLFSFDLASPAVNDGQVDADDILALQQPFPVTAIDAAALGLGNPADELDALSGPNIVIHANAPFLLLFSVTRETQGIAAPDESLINANVPYNVVDQAARGHQAGDEFMSTLLYILSDGESANGNNVTVRNNYDEGGSDLAARPETSANSVVDSEPQDNVDALADVTALSGPYFSASADSTSLPDLSGITPASGANIFFYNLVNTRVYASYADLGLAQTDDVDALIVFDYNKDGVFDSPDRVLFSLTPNSPSLATLDGASAQGAAADVFQVRPNQTPELFASAASLGLGAPTDDIDALDLLPCINANGCALLHGIRLNPGDFDNDGDVDQTDQEGMNDCFNGDGKSYNLGCEPGDFDHDGDIDCRDWLGFAAAWTDPQPPPFPPECRGVIPAASPWGLVSLLLLIGIAAAIISNGRRPAH